MSLTNPNPTSTQMSANADMNNSMSTSTHDESMNSSNINLNEKMTSEYKTYFKNKFISLFEKLILTITSNLPPSSEEHKKIMEVQAICANGRLNYEKIMQKLASNNKLMEALTLLHKTEWEEMLRSQFYSTNDKYWVLMPNVQLNIILLQIESLQVHEEIYECVKYLFTCATTFESVVKQIALTESNGDEFNPFDSLRNVSQNIDIESLYDGVEKKDISVFDMIAETLINQKIDGSLNDCMKDVSEHDVRAAASTLTNTLQGDKFQENQQTSNILTNMLGNIEREVIKLKNNSNAESLQGKQGMEQLLGIAQNVASDMMSEIKTSNVSPLEIWNATSMLAKTTVKSDAFDIVDLMIRKNIVENTTNMNQKTAQNLMSAIMSGDVTKNSLSTSSASSNASTNSNAAHGSSSNTEDNRKQRRDKRKVKNNK